MGDSEVWLARSVHSALPMITKRSRFPLHICTVGKSKVERERERERESSGTIRPIPVKINE